MEPTYRTRFRKHYGVASGLDLEHHQRMPREGRNLLPWQHEKVMNGSHSWDALCATIRYHFPVPRT